MDMETIRTVYTVAITRSFSKAASMIPCSQPSVSRRIKLAEEELGVTIFERHSNHEAVSLTKEGHQVVDSFVHIMEEYDALVARFKDGEKDSMLKTITVGFSGNTMLTSIGSDTITSDFIRSYPNTDMKIRIGNEDDVLLNLNMGKVDYAVFVRYIWNNTTPYIQYEYDNRLHFENIGRSGLFIACGEGSDISKKTALTMLDIKDLSFLCPNDMHQMPSHRVPINHVVFFEACRMFGFSAVMKTVDHRSRAWREQSVANGEGFTHSGLPAAMRTYNGISYVPLTDAPIHAEFFLASKKPVNQKEFGIVLQWLSSYFK